MTAPSTQFWGGDVYLSTVFPLDSAGALQPPDDQVYEGLEVDGARTFDLTPAEGSYLVNIGNGRLRDTIYRAPREASRAELRVGYSQLDVIAALSGVSVYTVGEAQIIGRLTNLQGSEPDCALLLTQAGHDENGLTRYLSYIIPKGKAIPIDSPFNDNALELRYAVTISNSRKEVWGETFTVLRHGFTETGYLDMITEGKPKIVAWKANGYDENFAFPAAKLPTDANKISVWNWNDGTEYTGGTINKLPLTHIDFASPPAADDIIVAKYEY
jgi:hypothetical protein